MVVKKEFRQPALKHARCEDMGIAVNLESLSSIDPMAFHNSPVALALTRCVDGDKLHNDRSCRSFRKETPYQRRSSAVTEPDVTDDPAQSFYDP
jgi:hypothetical protein